MGPRAGLDGCENLDPNAIRSPDRPARSESIYRPSYPGPIPVLRHRVKYCTDGGGGRGRGYKKCFTMRGVRSFSFSVSL